MKKLLAALLCAGLIAVMCAGCGYNDALASASSSNTEETQATKDEPAKLVKDTDYKDNLDGLCEYFMALGYISSDKKTGKIDETQMTKMDYKLIGAKDGKRFTCSVAGGKALIEFYEYDLNKLDDTAEQVISSVKKDGTFTILELDPVKAYLSDSGKYLMVYTDRSIDEKKLDKEADNYKQREKAVKYFTEFHK